MAAGGVDRLSQFPDDLLRRVLHFAPLKEAASATALSRRWRTPLWLSSGAVNLVLETRLESSFDRYSRDWRYCYYDENNRSKEAEEDRFFCRRDDFFSAALEALEDADAPITSLTLRLEFHKRDEPPLNYFLNSGRIDRLEMWRDRNLFRTVLSDDDVASRVEELRLVAQERCRCHHRHHDEEIFCNRWVGLYMVTLDSLPSETLRVLDLTNCKGLYQPKDAAVILPRLSSLRLRHCSQHISSLQHVIDVAPALAAIHLECNNPGFRTTPG